MRLLTALFYFSFSVSLSLSLPASAQSNNDGANNDGAENRADDSRIFRSAPIAQTPHSVFIAPHSATTRARIGGFLLKRAANGGFDLLTLLRHGYFTP